MTLPRPCRLNRQPTFPTLTKLALDLRPSHGSRRGPANSVVFSVNLHGAAESRPIFYGGDAEGRPTINVSSPQIAAARQSPRSGAPGEELGVSNIP
jgi:hypothetical protein